MQEYLCKFYNLPYESVLNNLDSQYHKSHLKEWKAVSIIWWRGLSFLPNVFYIDFPKIITINLFFRKMHQKSLLSTLFIHKQ